jgi:hypothetical protein
MPDNRWIRFIRNYGPIPTNDNMYDESIQRALRRHRIDPIVLPAQFVDSLLENLRSDSPQSEILTGTAGDGKTYHCREAWLALGGSEAEWGTGRKIQVLPLANHELVVVKDLSELRTDESSELLTSMALAVQSPDSRRVYLVAANHGQLLEKLKAAPQSRHLDLLSKAVEELLVTGTNPLAEVRLTLRDLSRQPAGGLLNEAIGQLTQHPGWDACASCPMTAGEQKCPISENRSRMMATPEGLRLRERLTSLIELGEHNGVHFPVRQLLALVSNMLLGHPAAPDGLMSCTDVPDIVAAGTVEQASLYRNVFGENLKPRRAEKTELFRKLTAFGIGGETSNRVDSLLVYGADDPALTQQYAELVLDDQIYGGTSRYSRAQRAYLEGYEPGSRENFLPMLRAQRQRLFFTIPEPLAADLRLWDLTVFQFGGLFLDVVKRLRQGQSPPRGVMPLLVRGLNRIFTGMLVQNQDELVVATSGSHSQSKTSPLLDESISVPRQSGEEVTLVPSVRNGAALSVRLSRGDDPGVVQLPLTSTRFEFLNRVAEGSLPSSFSLECHEDLLAFKATLLSATERRRSLYGDGASDSQELVLRFIDLGADGRAFPRRVTVRA